MFFFASYGSNAFFSYYLICLSILPNDLIATIVLEQNTYNQCPVCVYPLTTDSAVCPRCGNDILEDISSLDQQSRELHHHNIEEKKAAWYTRCLTEKLNVTTENPPAPPIKSTTQESGRQGAEGGNDFEFLRTVSRADLLQEGSLRKKWWNAMNPDWKEIIKTSLKSVREPSEQELLDFLETTHLRCDNRRIHNLLPVRVLEKLQQLRCDESPVDNLEPLQHLDKLQYLYAFDCDFSSLEPLRNLKRLKLLWISSTQVTSLEPISNLLNLEELYCSETLINDLKPLRKLINLEKLSCYKTGISSLDPLSQLENLIELGINGLNITDLAPLSSLITLEYLRCNGTGIKSIEPLRSLVDLKELSLSRTQLTTIAPLEELSNLEELDISNTPVNSIEPIMHLQQLEKLELSTGQIPQEELERFIELHPGCQVAISH